MKTILLTIILVLCIIIFAIAFREKDREAGWKIIIAACCGILVGGFVEIFALLFL